MGEPLKSETGTPGGTTRLKNHPKCVNILNFTLEDNSYRSETATCTQQEKAEQTQYIDTHVVIAVHSRMNTSQRWNKMSLQPVTEALYVKLSLFYVSEMLLFGGCACECPSTKLIPTGLLVQPAPHCIFLCSWHMSEVHTHTPKVHPQSHLTVLSCINIYMST